MVDIVGAWRLLSSLRLQEGVAQPIFGDPPSGQLQYTGDGRMSAFLMNPAWARSGRTASGDADPLNEFFAYAGEWSREGTSIRHDIDFCTLPALIGTRFIRSLSAVSEAEIELATEPAATDDGASFTVLLRWRRYGV